MAFFITTGHAIQHTRTQSALSPERFHHTAVCIVLAAGYEIQANLQFNIFSFSPFVGVHSECKFATLQKVGITVRHVQLYLHWACQKMLHCENIGAEKGHKLRYFRSRPNTIDLKVSLFPSLFT